MLVGATPTPISTMNKLPSSNWLGGWPLKQVMLGSNPAGSTTFHSWYVPKKRDIKLFQFLFIISSEFP